MSDGLSALGALYLAHLDDIAAGRQALQADIPRILAQVAARAGPRTTLDASVPRLKREWVDDHVGAALGLRLRWPVDGLPTVTLNDKGDEAVPAELADVFPPALRQGAEPPLQPTVAGLRADATAELHRCWVAACERIAAWLADDEVRRRATALAWMQRISALLVPKLTAAAPDGVRVTTTAGRTEGHGPRWPCIVQWKMEPAPTVFGALVWFPELDRVLADAPPDPIAAEVTTDVLRHFRTVLLRYGYS